MSEEPAMGLPERRAVLARAMASAVDDGAEPVAMDEALEDGFDDEAMAMIVYREAVQWGAMQSARSWLNPLLYLITGFWGWWLFKTILLSWRDEWFWLSVDEHGHVSRWKV